MQDFPDDQERLGLVPGGGGGSMGSEDLEYKDEGYIELVLKVLARMCDGQFAGLQVSTLKNLIL